MRKKKEERRPLLLGWCITNNHEMCKRRIRNSTDDGWLYCQCSKEGCPCSQNAENA